MCLWRFIRIIVFPSLLLRVSVYWKSSSDVDDEQQHIRTSRPVNIQTQDCWHEPDLHLLRTWILRMWSLTFFLFFFFRIALHCKKSFLHPVSFILKVITHRSSCHSFISAARPPSVRPPPALCSSVSAGLWLGIQILFVGVLAGLPWKHTHTHTQAESQNTLKFLYSTHSNIDESREKNCHTHFLNIEFPQSCRPSVNQETRYNQIKQNQMRWESDDKIRANKDRERNTQIRRQTPQTLTQPLRSNHQDNVSSCCRFGLDLD